MINYGLGNVNGHKCYVHKCQCLIQLSDGVVASDLNAGQHNISPPVVIRLGQGAYCDAG